MIHLQNLADAPSFAAMAYDPANRPSWAPTDNHLPANPSLSTYSDIDLLARFQRTTGERGDAVANAILAEIKRRGLDT